MNTKTFRFFAVAASILAGLSVAFGAFGAHMLADVLSADQHTTFQTAVRYQIWHALALLVIATSGVRSKRVVVAAWLLLVGSTLFSGSLYVLVLAAARWAGPVTPVGGLFMISGWAVLAWALATSQS